MLIKYAGPRRALLAVRHGQKADRPKRHRKTRCRSPDGICPNLRWFSCGYCGHFSLTASSQCIYRPRASPLADRREEALDFRCTEIRVRSTRFNRVGDAVL